MKGAYYRRNDSYSRSYNATEAESESRYPLTRAIAAVRSQAGVSVKDARAALVAAHDGEWHHVGKFASRVNYYDPEAALDLLQPRRVAERAAREAMAICLSDEVEAESTWEDAWLIRARILAAVSTGHRAFTVVGKRLVIFAAPDAGAAKLHAQRWSEYGREMAVEEVFA